MQIPKDFSFDSNEQEDAVHEFTLEEMANERTLAVLAARRQSCAMGSHDRARQKFHMVLNMQRMLGGLKVDAPFPSLPSRTSLPLGSFFVDWVALCMCVRVFVCAWVCAVFGRPEGRPTITITTIFDPPSQSPLLLPGPEISASTRPRSR